MVNKHAETPSVAQGWPDAAHLQLGPCFGLMESMGDTLTTLLADELERAPAGPLRVAFSGGPDSSALLHALSQLPEARARGLRALHVDHGLHDASAEWSARCLDCCAHWQVPLDLLRVEVPSGGRTGLEAAARAARYAALTARLPAGGLLVLAHHREDQAETVLLKLLRGAGPEGLGGMRSLRPVRGGCLWRPLLDCPRAALRAHLHTHMIKAVEDPANDDSRHARSHLRQSVWPLLRRHWPEAAQTLGHVARMQQLLADDLQARAERELRELLDTRDWTLDCAGWLGLPVVLKAPVLAQWLHQRGLEAPGHAQREALQRALQQARGGQIPELRSGETVVRAWRGRLHAERWQPPAGRGWKLEWTGTPIDLPGGGLLALSSTEQRLPIQLNVRATIAGERLRPFGHVHRRSLGDLFQKAQVPPWWRAGCPIIEAMDGTVLALGDFVLTQAGHGLFSSLGVRPAWYPRGSRTMHGCLGAREHHVDD